MGKRYLSVLVAFLALGGCGDPSGPSDTYKTYLEALSRGDLTQAFQLLSRASQDRLASEELTWLKKKTLAGEDTAAHEGDSVPGLRYFRVRLAGPDGENYPPLPADVADLVEAVEEDGDRARLMISTPLGLKVAQMFREDGEWRVVLGF